MKVSMSCECGREYTIDKERPVTDYLVEIEEHIKKEHPASNGKARCVVCEGLSEDEELSLVDERGCVPVCKGHHEEFTASNGKEEFNG